MLGIIRGRRLNFKYFKAMQTNVLKWESLLFLYCLCILITVCIALNRDCLTVIVRPPITFKLNDCDSVRAGESVNSLPC